MRKRIFFFHTLALLAALVTLLTVSGAVVHLVSDFYRRQAIPAADGRSDQVQTLLTDWPDQSQDWQELDRQLSGLEFRLVVERRHKIIYSSLDRFQEDLYLRLTKDASWPESGALAVQDQGFFMVGRRSGGDLIVAIAPPAMPEMLGRPRPQAEAAVIALFISGVIAIGVIVLLSLLFTRYQVKQIMRPVNALTAAAKRVEKGDFSTPVNYVQRDEFSAVCAAFDHMQQHLLAEREKNAAYEQARTDLVAGISHDLRTPLTSVKGYIKGLRDGVARTPEKQRQYLDVAYRKACAMDVLLQRLFYFSKLETGNLPLFREQVVFGDFLRKFVSEIQGELEARGGTVLLQGEPGSEVVWIDTEQFYRVLSNLTDNARHYAQTDALRLTLTVWNGADGAHLRFADNGRGVPEEQLPHLFEQFWRGDQARGSRDGEGSGLGLYIVKYIIEAHGGTISARNDGGLVFEITLPWEEARGHE